MLNQEVRLRGGLGHICGSGQGGSAKVSDSVKESQHDVSTVLMDSGGLRGSCECWAR